MHIPERLMAIELPEWARLHVYWRTMAYFNQFCGTAPMPASSTVHARAMLPLSTTSRRPNRLRVLTVGSMTHRTAKINSAANRPSQENPAVRWEFYLSTTSKLTRYYFCSANI